MKQDKTSKQPEQIKIQTIGKQFIAVIEGIKYTKLFSKEEKEAVKKEIVAFNLRNSKERKKKIIKLLTPKEEQKKTLALVEKKVLHKKREKATLELKEAEKELKELVLDVTVTPEEEKLFKGNKLFKIIRGNLYLVPFLEVRMPRTLVTRVIEFIKAGTSLEPLINFWKLALLNPNEIARTKLFDYLANQNMTITPRGYIVTYRMVKTTGRKTLDGKPIFTSNHTGKENYIMGEVYSIPREECDEDGKRDCSRGLHTGTHKFIGIIADKQTNLKEGEETIGDGYGVKITTKQETPSSYGTGYDRPTTTTQKFDNTFGNQAIICLLSPMHVVSVPDSNTRKLRACELFFCGTTTAEEVINLVEKDYHIFDHNYYEYELDQINKMLEQTKLIEHIDSARLARSAVKKKLALENLAQIKELLKIGNEAVNSNNLTIADIHQIISSRVVKPKKLKNGSSKSKG